MLREDNQSPEALRDALIELVALLSDRRAAEDVRVLRLARDLIRAATKSLGNDGDCVLVDPFAGGGAIPVESARLGVRPMASDLNPVPVMLNKLLVEAVPKLGAAKINELLRVAARRVDELAREKLAVVHPTSEDGRKNIAYLWARTIRCEGPGCGIELPLVRSLWLDKKSKDKVRLSITRGGKEAIEFSVAEGRPSATDGIMRGGSAVCPACGFTTANAALRAQLSKRSGGACDARLLAVVTTDAGGRGRAFRAPVEADRAALAESARLSALVSPSSLPHESVSELRPSPNARGLSAVTRIGVREFVDLYTARQSLCLAVFVDAIKQAVIEISESESKLMADAVSLGLAAALGRCADHWNSCCTWNPTGLKLQQMFKRQAIPVVWDFCEANPFGGSVGSWDSAVECVMSALTNAGYASVEGSVMQADAGNHPLPDDAADIVFTDPPYYDSVPYADLSDFFYVWHRRILRDRFPELFLEVLTPKDEEAIWNPSRVHGPSGGSKDKQFYERKMRESLAEARRITKPAGIGVVVFAHKSTAGWEAILSALIDSGWVATASWPLDTELGTRMNAMGTASLASSVHIVCRPREASDGSIDQDSVGNWRDVVRLLPVRIHEWLPRLAREGVVGADAIFACLGPAMEVFSRYARVEKISGERVTLGEFLSQVWSAVSNEALSMIFEDAEAVGLEEDARLTAMWLWTLAGSSVDAAASVSDDAVEESDLEVDGESGEQESSAGFSLEYDAARKIAQGLGVSLETLWQVVEVKRSTARLLPVAERAKHLFGKSTVEPAKPGKKRSASSKVGQMTIFTELDDVAEAQGWEGTGAPKAGSTTLDRIHQGMLLFASGRAEALKRFLVDEGAGRQTQFWSLGQALSALYPPSSDEKRWVDGVLARKKSLGF